MKPGDHPEFYRFPAPAGRSRESTIVLDENGRFFHDGEPIEHGSMHRAFFRWIRRHPDDGRFILSNDYDWTYFEVRDVPFFVESVRIDETAGRETVELQLSDGSTEPLSPQGLRVGAQSALYVPVKDGAFEARFSQSAQIALEPRLVEGKDPERIGIRLDGAVHDIPLHSSTESAKTSG